MKLVNHHFRRLISMTLLCAFFLVAFPNKAEAKFWGQEITGVADWSDGECIYRETCWDYYIFWIVINSDCKIEKIDCP